MDKATGDTTMTAAEANVAFDDDRIRVTSWTFATAGASTGRHRHEFDYVVVPITGGTFTVTSPDGSLRTMTQVAGTSYLGTAGTEHEVSSSADAAAVFVEVELKR
jgi:quercetin dioxygenase-like cupin family protein